MRDASDRLPRWWRSTLVRWAAGSLVAFVIVVAATVIAATGCAGQDPTRQTLN